MSEYGVYSPNGIYRQSAVYDFAFDHAIACISNEHLDNDFVSITSDVMIYIFSFMSLRWIQTEFNNGFVRLELY